jgi:exodeoxyribonuclease-3
VSLQRSLNRLSSGSRINSSFDDAGGLAVSMRLSASIRRTEATQANVNNALAFLQTQDGVLKNADKVLSRMTEWSRAVTSPTILTGDFNVAPLEHDVWSHKQLVNVVSHTKIECEHLAAIKEAADWVDVARHFVEPSKKLYTWWSYRAQDWETSDRGRRLDHMWVTPDLKEKAKSHVVHKHVRGWGKPSDHAPIVTEFAF